MYVCIRLKYVTMNVELRNMMMMMAYFASFLYSNFIILGLKCSTTANGGG